MKGEMLDGKYRIERELGKGGMGTVYLATHIGTDRPVAVKVISPEYMKKAEFVERFRREARAAGRLRHPNVVNVTDFGFANTSQGKVAYLVMEYLDGCTLAEILEEEKKLSLSWSLDIIEQICSAVHQAHLQGVIHRDLKPENIWLEPNQRGGYTVKVLDFGIAKLENLVIKPVGSADNASEDTPNDHGAEQCEASEYVDAELNRTEEKRAVLTKPIVFTSDEDSVNPLERQTLLISEEKDTAILQAKSVKNTGTQVAGGVTGAAGELTRFGVVLGTPAYMSPEQCRGDKLDARSDVYSLGVIAYRMLSGKVPFEGDFNQVMQAHIDKTPPPLDSNTVPTKVKEVINQSLMKDPEKRPQTPLIFASKLRAASEGIGTLLQKALIIYSQHFPKFLLIGSITSLPSILIGISVLFLIFFYNLGIINLEVRMLLENFVALIFSPLSFLSTSILIGLTTWLVAKSLAIPLRPLTLRGLFRLLRPRLKKLLIVNLIVSVLVSLGFICFVIPGVWLSARFSLVSPVIVIEEIGIKKSFSRSVELVRRAYGTALALVFISYATPLLVSWILAIATNSIIQTYFSVEPRASGVWAVEKSKDKGQFLNVESSAFNLLGKIEMKRENMPQQQIKKNSEQKDMQRLLFQLFFLPFGILFFPFISISSALFYFKTRLLGGESLQDLLIHFEQENFKTSKWQEKMKIKLVSFGK
jgi:serine/threonine protein kinase